MIQFDSSYWALILGGSSGFGLATGKKLARHGMNVAIVHRDRRGAMSRIEKDFDEIRATGVKFVALNLDALSTEGRKTVLDTLAESMGATGKVRLLLHSIAFGNLKPLAPVPVPRDDRGPDAVKALAGALAIDEGRVRDSVQTVFKSGAAPLHPLVEPEYGKTLLEDEDMARTIHSMGTSLVAWVQDVFARGMFAADARVLGLTSEGNAVAWRGYAAVSAAKAALESVSRSIAYEFAPYGVRSNILQPGVTDTPALRAIPGSEQMSAAAALRNPYKRLTTPLDVANFVALMCLDEAAWVNGEIIRVDGGEKIGS